MESDTLDNVNSLFYASKQCVVDLAANETTNETLYLLILAGPLLFYVLALCLAPLFLHRYKKRVSALMSTSADIDPDPDSHDSLLMKNNRPPQDVEYGGGSKDALWHSAQTRLIRFDLHISQTVALHLGLLFAAIIIGNRQELTGNLLEDIVGILAFATFLGLLGMSMLESLANNLKALALITALSLIFLAFALQLEARSDPELIESEFFMIFGAILILFASLHAGLSGRQLKNIVPYLAVAFTLFSIVGYLIFRLHTFSTCIIDTDRSNTQTLIAGIVSMVAGFFLALRTIKWIADRYEIKQISDRQVRVGCWLIFTSIVALLLMQVEDEDSIAVKPIAILIPLVTVFSFWFYFRNAAVITVSTSAQRMLLLRVFSSDNHGEKWLSAIERFWRHLGPVYLIAGPDLAKSSVDPYELYKFLSGNIKTLFIRNEKQATKHLEEVDSNADPDGRYRINEFFCLDNTWEFVAQGLIKKSDVVVLDLRNFELSRVGTAKEIEFLSRFNAFSRSLVLVDDELEIVKLIEIIRQLTGLKIAHEQFVVVGQLSADETVMRLLDLREQNLDSLYVASEPSNAAYLTDESLQEAERKNARRNLVSAHEQSRYGIDYIVLGFGLAGLAAYWIQLLAPLYLLFRKVSLKRICLLVLITYCAALLYHVHGIYLPQTWGTGASLSQYRWSISLALLSIVFWSVIWFHLSRKAKRWIYESQEPLRTALKMQSDKR